MEPTTKTPSLERNKLQARRLTAMQELLACLNTTKSKTPRWREEVKKQTRNTPENLVRDTDLGNAKEKETLNNLMESRGNRFKQIIVANPAAQS